ncbi:MAG TPA: DUF1003 domain-containing protein [Pyrinomonadaceae bacterium]|nr:DUF1003 domain-containing protein [Pyrinomonadaceae bacterium]
MAAFIDEIELKQRTGASGEVSGAGIASPVWGTDPSGIVYCPACGGENSAAAVFCANESCGKALGEFRYVREELLEGARWYEMVAGRVADFIGKPHFVVVHALVLCAWVAINSGIVVIFRAFDAYPFNLLGIVLSVEAILMTCFLLISQNRQNAHADKRAELDYEVNVRTYREISEIKAMLRNIDR